MAPVFAIAALNKRLLWQTRSRQRLQKSDDVFQVEILKCPRATMRIADHRPLILHRPQTYLMSRWDIHVLSVRSSVPLSPERSPECRNQSCRRIGGNSSWPDDPLTPRLGEFDPTTASIARS